MNNEVEPFKILILVADDNPDMPNDTVRLLENAGYRVDQASSGEEALESARQHHPNLLLLDRDLPGMDGLEVCRRIRRDPALAAIFIVFVSGVKISSDEQAEGLESGADDYLTRPIANRELLARVDAYVRILILNRTLELRVEELKQAGEAARQPCLASQNLTEETVDLRGRLEAMNRESEKEIAIRKAHEREIERLSRLYSTLSQVNQAIVRTASREELLGAICRIAIEHAGYKLAWIGGIDPQTRRIVPLARAGAAATYLDEVKVYADERPEGQGPGGICIREGQPSVFNDFLNETVGRSWHAAAQAHGLRSVAAFPIHFQGRVWGALLVYDGEVGVFQDQEIALLVEAAKDISFALDNLEREVRRQRAEAALQRHEQLLDETQRISKVGGWEYEVATGRIIWTAEMFRIHGVADDYNPSPIETEAIEFYAPADKQRVASAFQQALETGEPFDLETELTTPQGNQKWVRTKGQAERVDGKIVRVFGNVMDVTERKVVQERERLARETLELLNKSEGIPDAIPDILAAVKNSTGMEAVALRLREGEDFPYYLTTGFPEKFVVAERSLCARDAAGAILRDATGKPVLECVCGNILCGRIDPALPFFTEGGSFWTNSTTQWLGTTTEADRQANFRNRCNSEGYESVALIPIRAGGEIIGLLQLNDHRTNQFTPELIRFLEGLGASIGIALSRKRAEAALKRQAADLQARNETLTRFNRVAVDRELRMIELKQEINALCRAAGQPEPYAAKTVEELSETSPASLTQAVATNPKP